MERQQKMSLRGGGRAMKLSASAPRRPVHEVVRVEQDEPVILTIHQIILDALRPSRYAFAVGEASEFGFAHCGMGRGHMNIHMVYVCIYIYIYIYVYKCPCEVQWSP